METINKIRKIIFNKYLIVFGIFITAMFISDQHNIQDRIKYERTIQELEDEIEYYQNKTATNKEKLEELRSNKVNLEKFARERYHMHKKNEDIYVIEWQE